MKNLCYIAGYYYFRVRIPVDLQGIFHCREIKKALKTKNIKIATSSVKLLSHELFKALAIVLPALKVSSRNQQDDDLFSRFLKFLPKPII